jgi:hypothetical protein
MASTARPQTTNAARGSGSLNNKMAAIDRKNPAGMTSSPAYFMTLPLLGVARTAGDSAATFDVGSMDNRSPDNCPQWMKGR